MQTWFRRLFWKIAPLESQILDATRKVLSKEMAELLESQLEYVTVVDRHSVESFFHLGSLHSKPELHFPCKDQIDLASLELSHKTAGTAHRARVIAEAGRLSKVVVRPAPNHQRWDDFWTIDAVASEQDPALVFPRDMNLKTRFTHVDPPYGWVAEFLADCGCSRIRVPAVNAEELAWDCSRLRAVLPSDYLEFSSQIGEASLFGRLRIWGVTYIREFSSPDADYYILGEDKNVGCFAVRRLDQSGNVYFLKGKHALNCGPSFRNAVETFLGKELQT